MYRRRTCKRCRQAFQPRSPNQQVHARCRLFLRRQYLQRYHREYQRKVRRELKQDWEGMAA